MRASNDRILELCRFGAAIARRRADLARRALVAARRHGVARRAAEECALMLVLYAGYPAALEAARLLSDTWPGTARARREGERRAWRERGERLCRRVYGSAYPRLVEVVTAFHPDLATWMLEEGYGRVLSRDGLSARERELITIAVLAACGWPRQLVSHLRGATRLGASRPDVRAAFAVGLARADSTARVEARAAWGAAFDPVRPADS